MWWQLDALELFYIVDLVKRALVTGYAATATQSRRKHALRHHAHGSMATLLLRTGSEPSSTT